MNAAFVLGNGGFMSCQFRFLRTSVLSEKLTWVMVPVLWVCYLHYLLWPMLTDEETGIGARWSRLIERIENTVSSAPPLVVVSPVALALKTQTRRDKLRQVFEVTGIDAAGCIRYAGSAEVLRTQTQPVYVYLRPLSVQICLVEPPL